MTGSQRLLTVTAFAVVAVLPLAVNPSGDAMNNLVLASVYVVMALGLNIVVGFAGLLDLGYVAFYALGSYTAAYLASSYWVGAGNGHGVAVLAGSSVAHVPGLHLNLVLVLLAAAAVSALGGAVIGAPTLRLRGDYIAVVTLAFGEILGRLAANGDEIHIFGGTLTRGPNAVGPIDPIDLPLLHPFGVVDLRPWYWFSLALVAIVLVVNVRLRDSRIGRAWIALREDEEAAAVAGVPVARAKLLAYATGAACGGAAGAFLASYLTVADARRFTVSFSVLVLGMVVVGGLGSIPGVMVGAVLLSVINNYLLPDVLHSVPGALGVSFDPATVTSGVYGVLIVLTVVLRPQGLIAARTSARW